MVFSEMAYYVNYIYHALFLSPKNPLPNLSDGHERLIMRLHVTKSLPYTWHSWNSI